MGPREQLDIAESLRWICDQPWSSGDIGLYGFSASAIAAYNAMRRTSLPCVRTAALLAGTSSIYRDLIFIGGMPNAGPAIVVTTAIGSAFLANLPGRFGDRPQSVLESPRGVVTALEAFGRHTTEDAFWRERSFPGPDGPPDVPILAATGFYDVESRGPFETFKAARGSGSRLLVIGAHDGAAGGTGGALPEFKRWFEHQLLGADNGADSEPRVRLYVGHGSHERLVGGDWTKVDADDWPVPGTAWRTLHLDTRKSGSARSVNDGSLALEPAASATTQSGPTVPSNTFATDPYTTSTVTSTQQMNLTEATSLTYSTPAAVGAGDVGGPRRPEGPAEEHVARDRHRRRALRRRPRRCQSRGGRGSAAVDVHGARPRRGRSPIPPARSCSRTTTSRPSSPSLRARHATTKSSSGRSATASRPATESG